MMASVVEVLLMCDHLLVPTACSPALGGGSPAVRSPSPAIRSVSPALDIFSTDPFATATSGQQVNPDLDLFPTSGPFAVHESSDATGGPRVVVMVLS